MIEESDFSHNHYGPDAYHDIADRSHGKTRKQVVHERTHRKVDPTGPKPYGYVQTHPLDGGVIPPKIAHVEPFFMDKTLVTNKEFGKFVRATSYTTEAEQFNWSFVLSSFLPKADKLREADVDPEAENWVAVDGAYWREPEGPGSSYKYRENHPVVHVSHRDAAEYCAWTGKRLPGEWEWEAAARAGNYGSSNRTLFIWGDEQDWDKAKLFANLWGNGTFPWKNNAEDGWVGTNPVAYFPPNQLGFYDITGNVWEWMRGGKHKARIVRGGSYVDSLDGSFNHAATLGARSTLHGTTTTGNVGFRCVRSPKRPATYRWVDGSGELSAEFNLYESVGQFHATTGPSSAYQFLSDDEVGLDHNDKPKKRKVIVPRTRLSTELM